LNGLLVHEHIVGKRLVAELLFQRLEAQLMQRGHLRGGIARHAATDTIRFDDADALALLVKLERCGHADLSSAYDGDVILLRMLQ